MAFLRAFCKGCLDTIAAHKLNLNRAYDEPLLFIRAGGVEYLRLGLLFDPEVAGQTSRLAGIRATVGVNLHLRTRRPGLAAIS